MISHAGSEPLTSVDDVLITAELGTRPARTANYEAESKALGLLAQEMATNPRGVQQKCAELVMELCHADSAGISIREPGGTRGILRWQAAAGAFASNLNGTMPVEASPCGTGMERNCVLLFHDAERFFPALRGVEPRIYENLLTPWHADGKAVGTLWAIKHTPEGRFDAEDARVLQSLARFAAAAFQMTSALDEAAAERSALHAGEERQAFLLKLSDALRPLAEAAAIQNTASRLLAEHFGASHAFYIEVDGPPGDERATASGQYTAPGTTPWPPQFRLANFGPAFIGEYRAGRPLVSSDLGTDPRIEGVVRANYRAVDAAATIGVPLVKEGRLVAAFGFVTPQPREWTGWEVTLVQEVAERTWAALERARAEAELRESAERLRVIVENAQDYAIFTTDPEGTVTDWREGAEAVFGYSSEEMFRQDCVILFTPEDRAAGVPDQERATAAAEGKAPDVRWHMRKDGSRVFIDGISSALRGSSGMLEGFLKIGQDGTERHAATERQQLLLAELQHRVRNTLGMIRSMVRFTAQGYDNLDDYLSHLTGRLDSLSRTQQLLTRSSNARVDLHQLVSDEMTAQAGGRSAYGLDGPPASISPKAAEVLSLALHELVTNSVKYGALGDLRNSGGRVNVGWNVTQQDGKDWLELCWREPAHRPAAHKRRGFGTELITERVPYELQGEGSLDINEREVVARISFPLNVGPSSLLETGAPDGGAA